MKTRFKLLASAGAAALLLTSPGLQAESTYGYSSTSATGVTATAKVNISVAIPTLILLRVGTATGVPDLDFQPIPGVTSAPTGATLAALSGDSSNTAANWNAAAPTFTAPTAQNLTATVWTNSAGGGSLAVSSSVTSALGGLSPEAITVSATGVSGSMPAHPANTDSAAFGSNFTRNTLHSATWAYSVDATALGNAAAGTYEQTTTYTATAL